MCRCVILQLKKGFFRLIQWEFRGGKKFTMFATAIRYIARKPKPKMKPIELKTPPEQTQTITRVIFDVLKEHGPLTIADTWEHVKVLVPLSLTHLVFGERS